MTNITFTAEIQHSDQRREFVRNAKSAVEVNGYVRVDVRHEENGDIPAFTAEHWFGPGASLVAKYNG